MALSITFVVATLLAWRYSNAFVRLYYKAAAVWLGFLSFLFLAALLSWIVYGVAQLFSLPWQRQSIAFTIFGAAILVGVYGLLNAASVRVNKISVTLPNLPASWRGRVVALVTDMHLGHVRGNLFAKRVVEMLSRLNPDIVLIAGDMYDGTAADVGKLAEPLANLSAPLGTYFVSDHEEFSDHTKYLDAVRKSGVRVLNNEKVIVDGLQLVGVHHRDSVDPQRFRAILRNADLDADRASILLTHAPVNSPSRPKRKSDCSSQATPTVASFSLLHGSRRESMAASCMD